MSSSQTRLIFWKSWLLLAAAFFCFSANAQLPEPLFLIEKNAAAFDLRGHLSSFLGDSANRLSIFEAFENQKIWQPEAHDFRQVGYIDHFAWFRIDLKNVDSAALRLVWALDIAASQQVDAWFLDEKGVTKKVLKTGIDLPFSQRLVAHRMPLLPFEMPPESSGALIVRMQNDIGSAFFHSQLFTENGWAAHDRRASFFWMLFAILMGLAVVVAAGLWAAFREALYGFYVGYVVCLFLHVSGYNGLAFEFFWPNSPPLALFSKMFWLIGASFFLLLFAFRLLFLALEKRRFFSISVWFLASVLGFFLAAGLVGAPIIFFKKSLSIIHFANILTVALIVAMLVFSLLKKYRPAYFFLVAVLPLLAISVALFLRNYNLIRSDRLKTQFEMPMAMLFEVAVFFVAILIRISSLRRAEQEKNEAQNRLQNERERISRDLHDHVGATLATVVHQTEGLHFGLEKTEIERVEGVRAAAREAVSQLRETIWAVQKEALSNEDLADRIKNWARQQTRHRPEIELFLQEKLEKRAILSPAEALHIFRITQEAVTNALKHAAATAIFISFFSDEKTRLRVVVADNGRGFLDHKKSENGSGNGLKNMASRAAEIGARLEIKSENGGGLWIEIEL